MTSIFSIRQIQLTRDHVYDQLLDAIVAGRLKPGTRIRERTIAEELNVSTTPVKEAVRRLEQDGLLLTEPRRGARVSNAALTSIGEIAQTRAKLEALAAGWAARKYTKSAGAKLNEVVTALKSISPNNSAQADRLREVHAAFHLEVRALAGNPFVDRFLTLMVGIDESMRRRAMSFTEMAEWAWAEHFEIHAAILRRDEELASELMERHILRSLDYVVGHMEKDLASEEEEADSLEDSLKIKR